MNMSSFIRPLLGSILIAGSAVAAPAAQADDLAASGTLMAAAGSTSCAVTLAGKVKCWGANESGQTGNGMPSSRETSPRDVLTLHPKVTAVATGSSHTCVLTREGAVMCWGANSQGQLGNNSAHSSFVPVPVWGMESGVNAISVQGDTSCAIKNWHAWCWGRNDNGQLGEGSTAPKIKPVRVKGLDAGVRRMSVGTGHVCAIDVAFALHCWGRGGVIGDGTDKGSATPVKVIAGELGVSAVSAGSNHTCALGFSGWKKCWGRNWSGELGTAEGTDAKAPADVVVLPERASAVVAAGLWSSHTCMLVNGGARCFGSNNDGALGDGGTSDSRTPVVVKGLSDGITQLSGSSDTSCVVANSHLSCWGAMVLDKPAPTPVRIPGL